VAYGEESRQACRRGEIVGPLNESIAGLRSAGATRVVVACVTAHHFLDWIDPALRARVISLVAVTVRELTTTTGTFLLLASQGTRTARLFEREPGWAGVADRVVLPGPTDQELVQRLIGQVKLLETTPGDVLAAVDGLRARNGCSGVILGCTDFHLHSRELVARYGTSRVVDALRRIAVDLDSYLALEPGRRETPR
jgi:aspartate racemase